MKSCKVMRNPLLKKNTLSTKPGGRIILKSSQGKYQKCILAVMKLSNTRNDLAQGFFIFKSWGHIYPLCTCQSPSFEGQFIDFHGGVFKILLTCYLSHIGFV
jgi:hypothetical protein